MAKGIIIDVGFEADISDLISEIERQFKNINFDDMIDLSDAFNNQAKDIKKQLSQIKNDIDAALSGTTKSDLNKQVQTLNKAVGTLSSSFKEMIKIMPTSQASKFTSELDSITSEIKEVSDVCDNAATAVQHLHDASNGNIEIVNSEKIKELQNILDILEKVDDYQYSNKSYTNIESTINGIIDSYKRYMDIIDEISNVEDNSSLTNSQKAFEIDKLKAEWYELCGVLNELFYTYKKFGGKESQKLEIFSGFEISPRKIMSQIEADSEELRTYILKRKTEIQSELNNLIGSSTVDVTNPVNEVNNQTKKNKITVPLDISTKASTLYKTAMAIISDAQSKLDGKPLEVQVALVSNRKTKKNKEILSQISGQLENISDGDIKSKLTDLITNLNKQIGEELHFNVEVKGSEKVSATMRELISNLKKQINDANLIIYPEIELTEEVRSKLQSTINSLSEGVTVNIGFQDTEKGSIKKEVNSIILLRKALDKVISAIDEKTVAFQIEEQTVTGITSREISSLQELIGWLNVVEDSVKELTTKFESMATSFKIDFSFNDGSTESISELLNENGLSKLASIKQLITSSINSGTKGLIKIPEGEKKKLLKDIQSLSNQINNIFETKSIDQWSSKFMSSLTEISNKIKTLFGSNALSDMIEQWNYADEIMKQARGDDHLRERAAVIDDKGNIYGAGTYDRHNATSFWKNIVDDVKNRGASPKIAIHSHSSDRIAASSLIQSRNADNGDTRLGGDLMSRYIKHVQEGIEKELTIALNDIEVFDSKGFYESNNGLDFTSTDIGTRIADKTKEVYRIFQKQFYQYFEQFVSQYGTIDADVFKNEIFSYNNNDTLINRIKDQINPQELLSNFFNSTKDNNYSKEGSYTGDFGKILYHAISNSVDFSSIDTSDLEYSTEELNTIYQKFLKQVYDNAIKILNNAFDISNFSYDVFNGGKMNGNYRDYYTFAMRQLSPQILKEALQGTGYKNNYQDYMKVYSIEDFIKQNPLGLSSGNLSDLFDTTSSTAFLETLDKIVIDLNEIKNFSSSDAISNVFNIKIDEDSLKSFIDEINRLIAALTKLPSILTEVFSGLNTINSKNPVNPVNKQIEELKKQQGLSQKGNTGITANTATVLKTEGTTVDSVINEEIATLENLQSQLEQVTQAVRNKTEAFREEGRVVSEITGSEVKDLDPLKNLESSFNNFKKFYDNNDLESEAGAEAALAYYNAYKEALALKVNKKDLQKYTIGKTDNFFTGNYANYKKGIGDLDLSGLNSEIAKYQEIIEKLNQPEVISIINSLSEAIEKLLNSGNGTEQTTKLLENLNKTINNLGSSKGADKIERIAKNLENFQKSIQALDISDSGFINSINSILEKGEELKVLGEVLKSTQKQINSAAKAAKAEDNLKQAQQYIEQYESSISEAVNKRYGSDNVLYQNLQATKDGLVQVIALVKEASGEYKKYLLTTTDGSDLNVKAVNKDQASLAKEVKQWQAYQKLKELTVPGATNLGEEAVSFTPKSENWDQLVAKAREFGIELENIHRIIRTVDEVGNESFQIFTDLSRITIGMNSNGVLFQKDDVLDTRKEIQNFKKDVDDLQKSLNKSFNDDLGIDKFLEALKNISITWNNIVSLNESGLIDNETMNGLLKRFEALKTSIYSDSIGSIKTDKKTPEFISQLREAESQLNLVNAALDKVRTGEAFTDEDIANIKLFVSQMRDLNKATTEKGSKLANVAGTQNLLGKIEDVLSKNTVMSKELRQEFEALSLEIKSFGDNLPADKLQEFGSRFKTLETKMKSSRQTGLSFFDGIIKRAKSMSQSFISMYLSLWDIIRYIRTGFNYIKELDTALTEMKKVSDESTASLKRFQSASFDIASAVGTTGQQIQNSTADWMGKTLVPLYGNI